MGNLSVQLGCWLLAILATNLKVSSAQSICGKNYKTLKASSGSLKSPNYPSNYPHNTTKIWRIKPTTAGKDERIVLQFYTLKLEGHSPQCGAQCGCDYIKVRNKCDNQTPLKNFCGSFAPFIVTSAEDELWVEFRSDHAVNETGFFALYTLASKSCPRPTDDKDYSDYCPGNNNTVKCCNRKKSGCAHNKLVTGLNGTISSPGFPSYYLESVIYRWRITVPQGYVVQLNFTTFETKGTSILDKVCKADRVEVRNGPCDYYAGRGFCGTFRGAKLPSYTSTGRHMFVKFKSDFAVNLKGFQANYRIAVRCTNDSKPVSCIENGVPSCCYPYDTAVICRDSGALYRSHCKSGKVCCIVNGNPVCCDSDDAAVTCTDSAAKQRSHCKAEEVCCIYKGIPDCCDSDDAFVTCFDSGSKQRSHCPLGKKCCIFNGTATCCDLVTCTDSFAKQRSHCKAGKVCCIENGHPDCCDSDDAAVQCTDAGSNQRSHCPKDKSKCCVVDSKPTCCSSVKDLKPWSFMIIMISALLMMV